MVTIAKKISKEQAIQNLMELLSIDYDEAKALYEDDDAIDHEQKPKANCDLPPERQRVAQMYARTGTRQTDKDKPTNYQFTESKPKKTDATKAGLISELADLLTNKSEYEITDVDITNPEREIYFRINGKWYSVTLTYRRNKTKAETGTK